MKANRKLTIQQMTRRVCRYIPELERQFVQAVLEFHSDYGLEDRQVQNWLRFFDSFVIGGRGKIKFP